MKELTLNQADRQRHYGRDYFSIGCTPTDEDCTQAGYDFEGQQNGKIECEVLIHQLRRTYGKEPNGCEWFILKNDHEFGIYYEAAIFYNCPDDIEESEEEDITLVYANQCENLPEKWDEEAKKELRSLGHTMYQPGKVVKMKAA